MQVILYLAIVLHEEYVKWYLSLASTGSGEDATDVLVRGEGESIEVYPTYVVHVKLVFHSPLTSYKGTSWAEELFSMNSYRMDGAGPTRRALLKFPRSDAVLQEL